MMLPWKSFIVFLISLVIVGVPMVVGIPMVYKKNSEEIYEAGIEEV